jgi:dynein heavy chain
LGLCFSPVGDAFRFRARKFPGVINCTSMDWFHEWPRDALINVASRFLEEIDFPKDELRGLLATVHHTQMTYKTLANQSKILQLDSKLKRSQLGNRTKKNL